MTRYRVEARPYGSTLILYMARRYREIHGGPFTESFANRLTWQKREAAERYIEAEKERGLNRVHGRLVYRIIEESGD